MINEKIECEEIDTDSAEFAYAEDNYFLNTIINKLIDICCDIKKYMDLPEKGDSNDSKIQEQSSEKRSR